MILNSQKVSCREIAKAHTEEKNKTPHILILSLRLDLLWVIHEPHLVLPPKYFHCSISNTLMKLPFD